MELFRYLFVLVHRSHFLVAFRHAHDERNPADVTTTLKESSDARTNEQHRDDRSRRHEGAASPWEIGRTWRRAVPDDRPRPALLVAIATINVWNRLNVATRQVAFGMLPERQHAG
jgi:hypothetical protein